VGCATSNSYRGRMLKALRIEAKGETIWLAEKSVLPLWRTCVEEEIDMTDNRFCPNSDGVFAFTPSGYDVLTYSLLSYNEVG
jgi:hypothetical protein